MSGDWSKAVELLAGGFARGCVWLALPAALMAYGILTIGRDVGRQPGVRVAAIACVASWCLPSFGLLAPWIVEISRGRQLPGDALLGIALNGACFAGLIGTIICLAVTWRTQMRLAERQGA